MLETQSVHDDILSNPDLRRAWVRQNLEDRGKSLAQLADEAGMSRSTLYRALHHPSRRAERVIADAVGVSPQEIFRERYDQYGLHISARRNRGPATEPLQCN